jgi:hypothetical protein
MVGSMHVPHVCADVLEHRTPERYGVGTEQDVDVEAEVELEVVFRARRPKSLGLDWHKLDNLCTTWRPRSVRWLVLNVVHRLSNLCQSSPDYKIYSAEHEKDRPYQNFHTCSVSIILRRLKLAHIRTLDHTLPYRRVKTHVRNWATPCQTLASRAISTPWPLFAHRTQSLTRCPACAAITLAPSLMSRTSTHVR